MDNKNYWTEFCNTTNQSMTAVSDDFREEKTVFVKRYLSLEVKHNSDEQALKNKKNAIMDLVDETQKVDMSREIDELLTCIKERDNKIEQIKINIEKSKEELGAWYNRAKLNSGRLCEVLRKYTNDETGVLNIVAYILKEVVSKEGLEMNKAIAKVKDIISSRKWSRFWNVFGYMFLIVILLAIQVFLSKLIGINMISKDVEINHLGRWIVCGFIIAFLTVEIFLVVRLFLQLRKKTTEIQQLQLLLYKMEIHKMTEEEIDRALESVQEAASMSNRY